MSETKKFWILLGLLLLSIGLLILMGSRYNQILLN